MRKQNKIVSLVLVLALLLGVFVVIPGSPAVASAAEGESFTPNMTFTVQEQSGGNLTSAANTNIKNAALSATPGMLTGFGGSKANPFDYVVVSEGNDSYVMFAPVADGTYGTDAQITFQSSNTKTTVATDWYVAQFDVASDSAFPADFYVCLPIRDANVSGTATFSPSIRISGVVPADGAWHKVTLVGNLKDNKQYVYVDGVLAHEAKASSADTSAHTQLTHTGLKFSNPAASSATYGEAAYIDNVSNQIVTGDNVAALSAAVTAGTIASWSGYQAPKGGKLPAMAKVNGKEVYSATELNTALDGIVPVTVEMLHDTRAKLTVNVDATVNTNGCANNVVAGTNVTASANGNVTTYDAPHKSSVTEAHKPGTGTIKTETADSSTSYVSTSDNYTDETADHWLVTDVVTGNKYLDIRPGVSFTTGTTHNHWNWITQNTTYVAGTYTITEFDAYIEAEVMTDLYIAITTRDSAGNKAGASMFIKDWSLPVGEWAHLTLVGDVDNNVLYVYVNGVLTKEVNKGLFQNTSIDAGCYFQGIRVNVNTRTNMNANQNFAMDNVKYTFNLNSSWLDTNIGAKSLVGSGIYDENYALPSIPALAIVDGELVNSPAELSAMLVGNTAKKVELLRDYNGTITVNCDAVIETNGYTVPTAGANVTRTNDGTVYTYDAPYQQSLSMSEAVKGYAAAGLVGVVKADVTDNLFYAMQWDSTMNGPLHTSGTGINALGYIGTNTITGDQYIIYDGKVTNAEGIGVNSTSNSYYELHSMTTFTYNASKNQYIIYDFDYAQLTAGTVAFSVVPRNAGGSGLWGASNVNLSDATAGLALGEFHHLTYVYDMTANRVHIFVNGIHYKTNEGGVTSAANFATYTSGSTTINMNGVRLGSNSSEQFATDNVAIRTVTEDVGTTAAGSLTAALSAKNIGAWTNAITAANSEIAPIATVDGEYVGSADALSALLNGRKVKNVEILRDEAATVTVNCDAVINTNGLNVNLVAGTNVTVKTDGNVMTFDAPWTASTTEKDVTNMQSVVDHTVVGNLIPANSSFVWVNKTNENDTIKLVQVTDVETGNTYIKLMPTRDASNSANIYINGEAISNPGAGNTDAAAVLPNGQGYVVYDLKLATDAKVLENLTFYPIMRNNASEGSTYPFGQTVYFKDYVTNADEWTHFTLVADLAANTQYVFINGELAGTAGHANNENGKYEYLNVKGFRLNLAANANIFEGESLLVDDMSVRVFKTSDELAAAITAKTLNNWSENAYDGTNAKLPAVATIDGTEYYSVSSVENVLAGGKNHVVSLERIVTGYANAASTATITTNGLASFIKVANGYNVIDNGDGTISIVLETRMGTVVVNINGTEAIRQSVLYGTDIAEFLNKNNSYVHGVIAADNGAVYTDATWNVTPSGVVDGDEVYNVTANKLTSDFVVLKSDGTVDTSRTTLDDFLMNDSSTDRTIVLAKNATLAGNYNVAGNRTLHLNGNTITFDAANSSVHAFILGSTSKNFTFIGGNIIDNVRSNTQAIVYADYGFASNLEFIDCDIYAVAQVGVVRGGTFTYEGCNINMLNSQNIAAFALAEYYNAGYTYNKVTLNLIDSDLRYVHASGDRSETMISIKDFSEWGGKTAEKEAEAIAKGADKLVHEINISGCTVLNGFGSSVIKSTTNNVNINIDNTQFNAKNVFHTSALGNITIGKNVLSAVKLSNLGEGIVEVNSGNPVAPYLYTDEYATVVWADGTRELWADGTYPVNAKYSKANVPMVEAGKSYNIADNVTVDISMKANLTLDANLKLNVYVPTTVTLTAFNMGGVAYSVDAAPVVKIDGAEFYHFVYEMAPHFATGDFTVAATVGETTVAKSIDLVEYANLVVAQYANDQNAQNLVKAVLSYVAAAGKHMGAYTQGYDATNNYADATAITVDAATAVNTMANVNAYFTGAALDLNAAPAWVFTVADGASVSGLVIKVDGKAVEYTVDGNKVIVELPAYDMLDTITVEIGGKSGQYNFAAYYTAMKTLADSIDLSTTGWRAGALIKEAEAEYAMSLLNAFYTYASYAAAYK